MIKTLTTSRLCNHIVLFKDRITTIRSLKNNTPRLKTNYHLQFINMSTMSRNASSLSSSNSSTSMRPWPHPIVESRGDYREEVYLEYGPLYKHQSALPRLPIPSLNETIQTFLPSALPLAISEEEKQTLIEACDLFPQQASELQNRLLQSMSSNGDMKDSSWLQLFWNTLGYLQVRDPLPVNVSYFYHFSDDHTLPLLSGQQHHESLAPLRGATILYSLAQFRKLTCSGNLKPETIGKQNQNQNYLCSVAFKYMFNACRIPHRTEDRYKLYDPSLHKHVIVAYKGSFFAMDFVDDHADPLPFHVILRRLQYIISTNNNNNSQPTMPHLGYLTTSDRDSWADARCELIRIGGSNMETALETLQSGAILLCLDDAEPISKAQCADIFWTGGLKSGYNRWFDKSIQIICTKNGKAGLVGEHSMMDGMPTVRLADYITKFSYRDIIQTNNNLSAAGFQNDSDGVENIFESVSDLIRDNFKINSLIEKAKNDFTTLINDHSVHVLSFNGYGSTYIKNIGYSPDAFVQMAIQLASYRLFKTQVGTYEASQMRPYLHGRTETTRSVSLQSEAFVKCMGLYPHSLDDSNMNNEKRNLLRLATDQHVQYLVKAGTGKGVDRHFFGLSMYLKDGEEKPALFSHPLFLRSKRWRLSTSHLMHPRFDNLGFGEVVNDGIGLEYAIKSESCTFNVAARRENGWTEAMCHLIEEALLEMKDLINTNTEEIRVKSKL